MAQDNRHHLKYVRFLREIAEENEPVDSSRMAAGLLMKNNLFVMGKNSYRTDPWAVRFQKNPEANTLHAEIDTIKRAVNHHRGDRNALVGSVLYICRVKRPGPHSNNFIWGLSKPCIGCMDAIELFGIKRVVYTLDGDDDEANVEVLDV